MSEEEFSFSPDYSKLLEESLKIVPLPFKFYEFPK
jgi:hypothetical protein